MTTHCTPTHSHDVPPDDVFRYAGFLARLTPYVDHEEAVGAAVVAFYESSPAPEGVAPLKWARRGMLQAIRKLYRPESPSLAVEWHAEATAPADTPPDVQRYLNALPPEQLDVVVRYFGLAGHAAIPQGEIADELGVSRQAVNQSIARALARMSKLGL